MLACVETLASLEIRLTSSAYGAGLSVPQVPEQTLAPLTEQPGGTAGTYASSSESISSSEHPRL